MSADGESTSFVKISCKSVLFFLLCTYRKNKQTFYTTDKEELLCMLRDIKSTVQENSSMLKKLLKENPVFEAPSSTSVPTKKFKPNLNLPLRTFEDVDRTERELKNATTRRKYVSQHSVYNNLNNLKGYCTLIWTISQNKPCEKCSKDVYFAIMTDWLNNVLVPWLSKKEKENVDCSQNVYYLTFLNLLRAVDWADSGKYTKYLTIQCHNWPVKNQIFFTGKSSVKDWRFWAQGCD